MEQNYTIDCVWCNSKKEFNKYVRCYGSDSKVVDHVAIKTKLVKSDPYGEEPHSNIIGLNITGEINNFFNGNKPHINLIYLFKNLDSETVSNLKHVMNESCEEPKTYEYNLVIINRDDYPKKGVLNHFDNVKFIES
jgi:hypothetical protein